MKRLFGLLLFFAVMLTLCSCEGNWESVNLNDPIQIPENGIIKSDVLDQIKKEKAIGVFVGISGEFKYEWTIFGTDITEAKALNLKAEVTKTANQEIQVILSQKEAFGLPALLSIHLNEKWETQSATAYHETKAVSSVSVTGSKNTILNVSLNEAYDLLTIRPEESTQELFSEMSAFAEEPDTTQASAESDDYLSDSKQTDDRVYSDGKATGQDKYQTDPVPDGKPMPVEPEDQNVNQTKTYTCTFLIECSTILNNLDMLAPEKLEMVPSDGIILPKTTVVFYEGESVFDVLQRVCRENGIHLESSWTPIYNTAYIEGIHNLYEFDCGALSGWMYRVDGWYPNYGCSRYQLKDGETVEWRYTCDLGKDIGGGYAVGG